MRRNFCSIFLLLSLTLCSCGDKSNNNSFAVNSDIQLNEVTDVASDEFTEPVIKPDLMQIKNTCDLATLKCCYNNVAKRTKAPGTGLAYFEKRVFWIEYK